MNETELRDQVRRRNVLHVALGAILLPLAGIAWWLSYWMIRAMAWIILYGFGEILEARWNKALVSHYVALGGLALLVVEGLYLARTASGVKDYFPLREGWRLTRPVHSVRRDRLAGTSFLVSQFLFAAPEATRQAVGLLVGRLPQDGPTLRQAARILDRLAADRRWHAVESGNATAARVLHALKLIWLRDKDGEAEMRIPPASDG